MASEITTKMLGDAGEHYSLSQLSFHGIPCAKMPDNWKDYDLVFQKNNVIERISVKTRSETDKFNDGSWFIFDSVKKYEWVIFILIKKNKSIDAWIIPHHVANKNSNGGNSNDGPNGKRRVSWKTLNTTTLLKYKENWNLNEFND
jgi:hypothetical protein